MNYRKISLNQSGLKGAELHFTELNEKGIPVLTKVYPKSVVHLALQKKFKELRKHLVDICGQTNADMKEDIKANYAEGALVKTIEFDGDKIFLQGEWERFSGKFIPLETCWIEESDEYRGWEELKELADSIKEETTAYFEGSVKVSDAETIAMWAAANHKESEFTMEKILAMPPEQLVELSIRVLEKGKGAVVMLPGEIGELDESEIEQIEEVKQEFDLSAAEPIEIGSVKEPKGKKKDQPVSEF